MMAKQIKKNDIYLAIAILIIIFGGFFLLQDEHNTEQTQEHNNTNHTQVIQNQHDRIDANTARSVVDATKPQYPIRFIDNTTIYDIKTGHIYKGTIDLEPTLDRIQKGGKYPYRNDGSVFRNRPDAYTGQPSLPKKSSDYYREYIHPTQNVSGPGPQRIIIGRGGEIYYTFDHYETFIRIK